jgi:hypothetical protein
MLSWLASLLVLFSQSNQAQAASTNTNHSVGSGTNHVLPMDDGTGTPVGTGSTDGGTRP